MSPPHLNHIHPGSHINRISTPALTPTSISPVSMSPPPHRTSSQDSDAARKRVCKACDRCRMKKSKCDGSHPCSRCKMDNSICVFGERKRSHDKVYPKGYVEMLEQQQAQLVAGLQELYRRSQATKTWSGPTLSEATGQPLTHDILAALNLLEAKEDGSNEMETFEEDPKKIMAKLLSEGASYTRRKASFSSDSDLSQHGPRSSARCTPRLSKAPLFDKNFSFAPSPAPMVQSPAPRQRQSYPPAPQPLPRSLPMMEDPQMFQQPSFSEPELMMRSQYAMQTPQLSDLDDMTLFGGNRWEDPQYSFDNSGPVSYPQQLANAFPNMGGMQDFSNYDTMDLDLQKFIQVTT